VVRKDLQQLDQIIESSEKETNDKIDNIKKDIDK